MTADDAVVPGAVAADASLAIRVIPCLDVAAGRVVKGVNFLDLRDAGDPVEAAKAYDAAGADELCFLDITASHEARGILLDVVRRTAEACFMSLTVGGGVRTVEDIRRLLGVLSSLVDKGNTVLVIEHNLDVIKTSDWVVDMGPEGGSRGGTVIAEGTPEEVAAELRAKLHRP